MRDALMILDERGRLRRLDILLDPSLVPGLRAPGLSPYSGGELLFWTVESIRHFSETRQ